MSQSWTDDVYASGHVGVTDLTNIENNMACIKSMWSGTSQPSNAVAGMLWHDTTNNMIKCYYNSAWVTVYDLANDYAIEARDCSRSVTAGTGLSGGGVLSEDRIISHAAHTGDVTGTGALTIANNAVDPTNTSHGALVVAGGDGSEYYVNESSYSSATQVIQFALKCPSSPTSLRLYARIKNAHNATYAYARMTVSGIGSATEKQNTSLYNVYDWYDCNTLSMAGATPGTVYTGYIDIRSSNATYAAYLQGYSIWWE